MTEKNNAETSTTRPIETLLKMDSYSDMSDKEVQMVIDYTAMVAAKNATAAAINSELNKANQRIIDAYRSSAETAAADMREIIKNGVQLKAVR